MIFDWDSVPTTLIDESTTVTVGAAWIAKDYTVPAGKRWLLTSWRLKCDTALYANILIFKTGTTTTADALLYGDAALTANVNYGSRAYIRATSAQRSSLPIELPAGTIIRFNELGTGAGQNMYTTIGYKEAPA